MYHLCFLYISSRTREEIALGPVVPLYYPKTTTSAYNVLWLKETGSTTPSTRVTMSSYISPKWCYREKQGITRKQWEIIYRSNMLSMPGNMKLCGKLPIINSLHSHWITVTIGGTHHDPNHKGDTNHQYNYPKMDPSGNMLNHNLHQTKNIVQNIKLCVVG